MIRNVSSVACAGPRRKISLLTLALVYLGWLLLAFPGLAAAQNDPRPTFIIAFVPVHWQGSAEAFARAANEQAQLFITESNIAAYADIEIVILEDNFTDAGLDSYQLVQRMVAFALERQPADRYVGLTDGDLAPGGDNWVAGWTWGPDSLGMVSEIVSPVITAHELGHTFLLCDEYLYNFWSRQNDEWSCPNPYPTDCPAVDDQFCYGQPAPDGRDSIMGPAGLQNGYAFNEASYLHLQELFAELFGVGEPLPPATQVPPTPVAPTAVAPTAVSPTPITPTPAPPTPTAVPPTPEPLAGRTIAFADPGLSIRDPNGRVRTFTSEPAQHISWNPDGESLAYVAVGEETLDIYILSLDDRIPRLLAGGPGRELHPAWLPDGRRLYLVSDRDGRLRLYRLLVADGTIAPVADLPEPCAWPAVSADGLRLALACAPDGIWSIYVTELDAAGDVVPGSLQVISQPGVSALSPAWDDTGERLAWAETPAQATDRPWLQIQILDLKTGEQHTLASEGPAWVPVWLDPDYLLWQQAGDAGLEIAGAALSGRSIDLLSVLLHGGWPAVRPGGE